MLFLILKDATGKVRVWVAASRSSHQLKWEYQPISGAIRDLDFTSDCQRLVVVGDGKAKY